MKFSKIVVFSTTIFSLVQYNISINFIKKYVFCALFCTAVTINCFRGKFPLSRPFSIISSPQISISHYRPLQRSPDFIRQFGISSIDCNLSCIKSMNNFFNSGLFSIMSLPLTSLKYCTFITHYTCSPRQLIFVEIFHRAQAIIYRTFCISSRNHSYEKHLKHLQGIISL